MGTQRGNVMVVILIGLAILAGTGYFVYTNWLEVKIGGGGEELKKVYTPTPLPSQIIESDERTTDNPDGSKTYNNDKYGFSLSYKFDETVDRNAFVPFGSGNKLRIQITDAGDPQPTGLSYAWSDIYVITVPNTDTMPLLEFSNEEDRINKLLGVSDVYRASDKRRADKWGKEGYSFSDGSVSLGYDRIIYLVVHKDNFFVVQKYINNADYLEYYNKVLNPIFESIEFY